MLAVIQIPGLLPLRTSSLTLSSFIELLRLGDSLLEKGYLNRAVPILPHSFSIILGKITKMVRGGLLNSQVDLASFLTVCVH